jgi:DNA-binding transcriptional MocR family regulator
MTAAQLISFARGAPSLDIVDVEGLKAAAARAFDADPAGVTGYGPATGYPALREWIANRYGVPVDHVLITNGSLQADAFLFDHLVSAGDEVVVEKPTYDRTLLSLRTMGAKVHQVTIDDEGLDTEELRDLLASGVRPTLAHVIPNFQNPAGVTLSLRRRLALIELAREYGFTIFEDDPYAEIRFGGEPLPSLLSLDTGSATEMPGGLPASPEDRRLTRQAAEGVAPVVVHASSFTKTVCPGVRVGYLIGARDVIAQIAARAVNTYISPNMLAEATVYQFCASGDIDRSIATVRTALAERKTLLATALRREFPDCRFTEPEGGYFLWVDFGEDLDVHKLLPVATAHGVAVVKGSDFLLDGGNHSLRLAYSAVTANQVDEGVRRLAAAVAEVRAG